MSRAVSDRRSAIRKATRLSWRISLSVSCDTGPILSAVASPPKILAHLDLDAFFAAVEELEQPELATRPLVVGGDPRGRGVVATANYEARKYGIRSAMSCAEALRCCPHAVFVRPRHRRYGEYSRAVAEAVQVAVRAATRLSCSLGVGTSKVVAKVASDRRKPGGITVVRPGREAAFLAPFDLRLLPGIGPRTEERLRGLGVS